MLPKIEVAAGVVEAAPVFDPPPKRDPVGFGAPKTEGAVPAGVVEGVAEEPPPKSEPAAGVLPVFPKILPALDAGEVEDVVAVLLRFPNMLPPVAGVAAVLPNMPVVGLPLVYVSECLDSER